MRRRTRTNPSRKQLSRTIEALEARHLLAGDLIAHWTAEAIEAEDGAPATEWLDSVAGLSTSALGTPEFQQNAINGRAGVRFDATDGQLDGLILRAANNPLARIGDFSAAVVFETSSDALVGGNEEWFKNTGLVDSNSNGLSTDWGLTINSTGQVAAGLGDGFGRPSTTVYSTETGLNDGQFHLAVVSHTGTTLGVSVDGGEFMSIDNASNQTRSRLDLVIGALATKTNGFTGVISDVRLYDGGLDQNEVNSLYSEVNSFYNNQSPIAVDDAYELDEDPGFFFVTAANGVLTNDTDPDGDPLTAVLVDGPKHGTMALLPDGSFTYSPVADFNGTDSFTYTANDFRPSEPATVTLTVRPTYDPPKGVSDEYIAAPGQILNIPSLVGILTNDINPDGAPLQAILEQPVTNGTLTAFRADGSFSYDPGEFTGTATFTYRVSDGQSTSDPTTVSIRVNSPPVANADHYSVDEDNVLTVPAAEGVLANDVDNEGDPLIPTVEATVSHGTLEFNAEDGSFVYTPEENYFGTDSFSYRVFDGIERSAIVTVSIDVNSVNDLPQARRDSYILATAETVTVSANEGVLANDSDLDGPVLEAVLVTGPLRGTVDLRPDGSFEYTPTQQFVGIDSFTYRATDSLAQTEVTTVDLVFEPPRGNTSPTGDSIVTFNEIMYNPPGMTDASMEWIELRNQMAIDMDISKWRLDGGIAFDFPEGTVIPGGGYLVIAADPAALADAGGPTAMGPFVGRLDNGGETVMLRNNSDRIMDIMQYNNRGDWPVAPDGTGVSLAKIGLHAASGEPRNWTFSEQVGGTPGSQNFNGDPDRPIVFNEIASSSSDDFQLELTNVSDRPVQLAGMKIQSANEGRSAYTFGERLLGPGEYATITAAELGYQPSTNEVLAIVSADGSAVSDARVVTGRLRGRLQTKENAWLFPTSPTFGQDNQFEFHDSIVINEIMYHAPGIYVESADRYIESTDQWLELYNRSDATVDLSGWSFSDGINYTFADGTMLGAGQYLVVSNDPAAMAAKYGLSEEQVVGPFDGNLSNAGELVRLVDANNNPADEVRYYDDGRWSKYADARGSSLELRDPDADNGVPESWAPSEESGAWVTITHRGPADNLGPQQYNEFLLGLLDAGEVLIDDVTVVENPDTEDARQIIQNGTFDNDAIGGPAAKWRIIGTQHGTVVEDPDRPGNHVLHLLATGPTEHMHNNAGTTFKFGDEFVRINRRATYEVSFRAKWIGGSNQLNSRIYFNRLQRTTRLPMSERPGTPGAKNSRFEENAGPTYEGLMHSPVVPNPGEPVTVSVRAIDPDAVQSMTLWYGVAGGPLQNVAMTARDNGFYEGTIPGQSEGVAVQFYVEGTDSKGASSTFPAAGADSRALYRVQDGEATDGPLHNLRIIMTPDDTDRLHEPTNVMSNDRIGATVIYKESEVFYNVGVRLKGSQRGRNKVVRAGFNIQFDPMNLFRGVHKTIGVDRSGSGDEYSQEEIIVRQILNHAGNLPQIYDDLLYVIAPQSRHTGTAMLNMARYNDIFLDSMYENGSQGTAFEYELVYYPTTTVGRDPEGLKLPNPDSVTGVGLRDLGDDKELYRWYFLIKNNRLRDDYSQLIKALKAIGERDSTPGYHDRINELLDVDEWLRALAVQNLSGIGDNYSSGAQHNGIFWVRPTDNRLLHFPWDMDFSFTAGNSVNLVGNGELRKFLKDPANEHNYYGHVWDILQTTFKPSYMDAWVDHFDELVPRQRFSGFKNIIDRRNQGADRAVKRAIPEVPFEITTANPLDVGSSATATLAGTGWVDVRTIRLEGSDVPLDIIWTTESTWEVTVPVSPGTHDVTLAAYNFQDELVTSATISVTSSAVVPVRDSLRVSEIHYNPAGPDEGEPDVDNDEFEFIELVNIGSDPLDLNGTKLIQVDIEDDNEGIAFTFGEQVLTPGARVVIPKNVDAFKARYGDNVLLAIGSDGQGTYTGRLSNGGETLTLVDASGAIVQQFAYDDAWYPITDGDGFSLELVDPTQMDLTLWNQAASWVPSGPRGGTPGRDIARPGDVNFDGKFNSTDLTIVFQAAEYEDDIPGNSTWVEGDWDRDGDFTTSDLVLAFTEGHYSRDAIGNERVVDDLFGDAAAAILDDTIDGLLGNLQKTKKRSAFVV